MMKRMMMVLAAGTLLVAAAPVKSPVKLAPADDVPARPVGAAARAKLGPEPLAKPAEDIGSAEDPALGQPEPPVKAAPAVPK